MSNSHDVTLKPSDSGGHKVSAVVNSLPSQSHTLLDFSKIAIGFVSLIMGFSITFLGQDVSGWAKTFLLSTWAMLIVTAILSCFTIACVANDSIHDRLSRRGTLISNLSFFALVASLICFSVFGYFNVAIADEGSLSSIAKDFIKLAAEEPNRISDISISDGKISFALQMPSERILVSIEKGK